MTQNCCKGCAVYPCFCHDFDKENCPCNNCLVKVVCDDGEGCSPWHNFADKCNEMMEELDEP